MQNPRETKKKRIMSFVRDVHEERLCDPSRNSIKYEATTENRQGTEFGVFYKKKKKNMTVLKKISRT